ncbi:MAG: hypothetical protein WB771_09275 [Solirubrobacterales bacterium]
MRIGEGRGVAIAGALAALLATSAASTFVPEAVAQGPSYPDAVVLVSGFTTVTPFTTPDPACNGQEGGTWDPATGVAAALKSRGFSVFTAPVKHLNDPEALPCPGSGTPLPPQSDYIDSGGDNDANGAALAGFLGFLRDNYGVARVQLVAHSDGGNWSRAALTQRSAYSGLTVASLTTLGTPYTGSFVADLAVEMQGSTCDFADPLEQDLCNALIGVVDLILKDKGSVATRQLTNHYLTSWNRQQSIGSCPVTTIAGTYVDIPLFDFSYYDPSDGLVGEASGLAERSLDVATLRWIPAPKIPNLNPGGTFPVVHSESLSFLSPNNLLNQPVISDDVAGIVNRTPAGGPPCNPPAAASAATARAAARNGHAGPRKATSMRLPLRLLEVPSRRGVLPRPALSDAIVVKGGVRVRCGGHRVRPSPLLADTRLRVVLGARCKGPVRVVSKRGKGRGGALLLRSHPRDVVVLAVRGRRARIRVRGPAVRDLRVTAAAGRGKRLLRINRAGVAKLPRKGDLTLRIHALTQPGSRQATASAVIAR